MMPIKRAKKHIDKPASSALLIINDNAATPVSWQQQTFNTLVTKIEKLRAELQKVSDTLNQKLDFYLTNILPIEADIERCQTESIKILYWHLQHTRLLSANQRKTLKELIASRLHDLVTGKTDEPDKELKDIFETVEGISFEEAKELEFIEMKKVMNSMFTGFGFDVDVEDLHSAMTEEEIARHASKIQEQVKEQAEAWEQKKGERKKTKKELAQEQKEAQMEEARNKNISSIYKQLAKIFHPDLERDEELKLQKEELMKQLTSAYEKKDLHTLLTLELGWIKKEEKSNASITNDKLAIYNEVLKEQVFELEREIEMTYQHPRYHALLKLVDVPTALKKLQLKKVQSDMLEELFDVQNDFIQIKQRPPKDVAHVKRMINDFKFQQRLEQAYGDFLPW